MDKKERNECRRLRLMELINDECNGVIALFARRIQADVSYVGRMLYPEGKAGKKGISVHTIDATESAFNLPKGWLDGVERQDECLAELLQIWPSLPDSGRRTILMMAQTLTSPDDRWPFLRAQTPKKAAGETSPAAAKDPPPAGGINGSSHPGPSKPHPSGDRRWSERRINGQFHTSGINIA